MKTSTKGNKHIFYFKRVFDEVSVIDKFFNQFLCITGILREQIEVKTVFVVY